MLLIGRLYKKLDIFGRELKFEEDNNQTFKTNIGATLTIMMLIVVTVIGFLFGKEIYQRKTPLVLLSNEILENSVVSMSDFPIILFFSHENGTNFPNIDSNLDVAVSYFVTDKNRDISFKTKLGVIPCDKDKFTKHKEYVEEAVNHSNSSPLKAYCINHDKDFIIKNQFTQTDSASILVQIYACVNRPSKTTCSPNAILDTKYMYVNLHYMNSFIDPKNYTSPITYFQDSLLTQVGNGIITQNIFRMSYDRIDSDIGWVLEDVRSLDVVSVQSINFSAYTPKNVELVTYIFEVARKRTRTTRSYMKVQELFAKVGGLFNACCIIFNVLLYDYVLFKFRVNYFKYVTNNEFESSSNNKSTKLNMINYNNTNVDNTSKKLIFQNCDNNNNVNEHIIKQNFKKTKEEIDDINSSCEKKIVQSQNNGLQLKDNNKQDSFQICKDNVKVCNDASNSVNKYDSSLAENLSKKIFINNFVTDKKIENNFKSSAFINPKYKIFELQDINISYFEFIKVKFLFCSNLKKDNNSAKVLKLLLNEEIIKNFSFSFYLKLINKINILDKIIGKSM